MKILDLGCGNNKHKIKNATVIGLDKIKLKGVDVIWDLEKTPLPFNDNYFDEIIASHILEHIENLESLLNDLYRILKPSGIIKIWVPNAPSHVAFDHPEHKRYFGINTFHRLIVDYNLKFVIKERKFNFILYSSKWVFLNMLINPFLNLWKSFTQKFFPFIIDEIYFELEVIKK